VNGNTPLHYSAENGYLAVLEYFDNQNIIINVKNNDSEKALLMLLLSI